jgi:anti-anti-sigma factor
VRIAGDLVSTTVEALRKEANGVLDGVGESIARGGCFKLDLTAAAMVDSAGLNLVVTLLKRAQMRGMKMQIAYTDANLLRTFIFTRLDQHIELVKVAIGKAAN